MTAPIGQITNLDTLQRQLNDAFAAVNTLSPQTAPSAPASGWTLYCDSGDANKLKAKAANGTVVTLGTP